MRGVASSVPRFQERALAHRRRPWRRIAWAVAVVAALALLVWLVWFSPVLAVRAVEVTGVSPAQAEAVRTRADVPAQLPLARADTAGIEHRVKGMPALADARVERSWPSTIRIQVVPRTPALVLKNPQGQLKVVDREGVAYADVASAPRGVPVVTATLSTGTSEEAVRAALSVIEALPESLARQVSSMTVSSADLVTFKLGAVNVVWGGKDAGPRKVEILKALLPTKPKVIDVSAPDTPVTR